MKDISSKFAAMLYVVLGGAAPKLNYMIVGIALSCRPYLFMRLKGRTIRKLIGSGVGGGAGKVQKVYSRKGKLNEKKLLHAK